MDSSSSPQPPPLPAHIVSFILSYISPLDHPLPPHMLSTPLRQRHHFLGLGSKFESDEDIATYLSWQNMSGNNDEINTIADILSTLPSPENCDPLSIYQTKYSFDGEAVYAHAYAPSLNSGSGLRLIFRWEASDDEGAVQGHHGNATNADNWKYHDAKPMPFPSNVYDSPQEALLPDSSSSRSGNESDTPISPQSSLTHTFTFVPNSYHVPLEPESEDDDYWNSYGRSTSDDEDNGIPSRATRFVANGETEDEKAEDAYWARYAAVHGTADSTKPSPLPQKRKLHEPSFYVDSDMSYNDRQPGSYDNFDFEHIEHLSPYPPGRVEVQAADPNELCPATLTRRLHAISPRASPLPSPGLDLEPIKLDGIDESPESPDTSDVASLTSPKSLKSGESGELSNSVLEPLQDEVALRETIKGVYRLWSASNSGSPTSANDKQQFLRIVQGVISDL